MTPEEEKKFIHSPESGGSALCEAVYGPTTVISDDITCPDCIRILTTWRERKPNVTVRDTREEKEK